MSLRQRTPTAFFLIVLLFLIIQFLPPLIFFLSLQFFILAALFEFYGLAGRKKLFPQRIVGVFFALVISASYYFEKFTLSMALFLCLLVGALYFVGTFNRLEKLPYFSSSIAVTFFGAFYLGFSLNYFYPLRLEMGPAHLYFLFAVIFLGDTGAYFVGRLCGRRKMTPIASPNKTWEGSAGGILLAAAGAFLAAVLLFRDLGLTKAILTGIIVHAAAQVSDPLESLFKRAAGIKDSSNVLPGHGGFLDRIDSMILAAPCFYYLVKFFWK
jgi:phosphatidate cytidylyltransferase